MTRRTFHKVGNALAFALALLFGCESTTFVDCPSFEMWSCMETDACRYILYGDGTGDCRNTCDPLEEEPCHEGFDCRVASYWESGMSETDPEPLEDLCVEY